MALTETIVYDKIEVVGDFKDVQVRKADIIKKDGKELARSFERYVLQSGNYNMEGAWEWTDISSEPTEVQAICNAVWTDSVKTAWKADVDARKAATPSV